MGGNAINGRRINHDEYQEIRSAVEQRLPEIYDRCSPTEQIGEKQDFGDLDVVVTKPKPEQLYDSLRSLFDSDQIVDNSEVVSFEFRGFQVDLIHVPPEELELAKIYYSYNDLGMLMGLLAKRLYCKYGPKGLLYTRRGKYKNVDITLTKDPQEIFDFLGLSFWRFLQGFHYYEEMFEYVMSSLLFDYHEFMNLSGWNHWKRKRNQKRKTWKMFINYMKQRRPVITNELTERPLKEVVIPRFPHLLDELRELNKEENRKEEIKTKFNGDLVRKVTGLEGEELGRFIVAFKASFNDFEEFVLRSTQREIINAVANFDRS